MHCQGNDNMAIAVKVEHLRRFLDGDLAWTACKDLPSVAACIERATVQARELADSGDRVAQYQLGRDDGHLDKDPAMLRRAAEGGFAPAQTALGRWLRERNQWAESARWYRRSADQGDPAAPVWTRVGVPPRTRGGLGIACGPSSSCSSRLAADTSLPSMEWVLSYEDGHGTQRDAAKSRRWIQRAADKGLKEAREKLSSLALASTHGAIGSATVHASGQAVERARRAPGQATQRSVFSRSARRCASLNGPETGSGCRPGPISLTDSSTDHCCQRSRAQRWRSELLSDDYPPYPDLSRASSTTWSLAASDVRGREETSQFFRFVTRAKHLRCHARTLDATGAATPWCWDLRIARTDTAAPVCKIHILKPLPRCLRLSWSLMSRSSVVVRPKLKKSGGPPC